MADGAVARAMPQQGAAGRGDGGALRLVVFDFDQTLTRFHVFKTLAGWTAGGRSSFEVPAPHASSEEGQLCRIDELNRKEFQKAGGFACAAFGGASRVDEVRKMLCALREGEAELVICTKGLVGPVKKCLLDLDLLQHFSEVYGNIGSNYGLLAYDREASAAKEGALAELLGRSDQASWGTKDRLISLLMRERGLQFEQCVLVEDDPDEIQRAKGVCRTLFVQEASGMTAEHNQKLVRWVTQPAPADARDEGRTCSTSRWACAVM